MSSSLWSVECGRYLHLCVDEAHDKVRRLESLRGSKSKSKILGKVASILTVVR